MLHIFRFFNLIIVNIITTQVYKKNHIASEPRIKYGRIIHGNLYIVLMIVKIMVKKNRFSLGNDEYELIKCLIHYSLGKYDFDQIARKREMIESRNVCSENGYL